MSTFELKKTSINEYSFLMKDEDLKKLSFRIFSDLENIVKSYEHFVIVKQDYNDRKNGWAYTLIKSKLNCKSFQDQEKKQVQDYLEIELTGGYRYSNESLTCTYNQLDIKLQSSVKEVDTKIIEDLFTKFKSFEETIQRKYEEFRDYISSESLDTCGGDGRI